MRHWQDSTSSSTVTSLKNWETPLFIVLLIELPEILSNLDIAQNTAREYLEYLLKRSGDRCSISFLKKESKDEISIEEISHKVEKGEIVFFS